MPLRRRSGDGDVAHDAPPAVVHVAEAAAVLLTCLIMLKPSARPLVTPSCRKTSACGLQFSMECRALSSRPCWLLAGGVERPKPGPGVGCVAGGEQLARDRPALRTSRLMGNRLRHPARLGGQAVDLDDRELVQPEQQHRVVLPARGRTHSTAPEQPAWRGHEASPASRYRRQVRRTQTQRDRAQRKAFNNCSGETLLRTSLAREDQPPVVINWAMFRKPPTTINNGRRIVASVPEEAQAFPFHFLTVDLELYGRLAVSEDV